jgi:hypothetical protein
MRGFVPIEAHLYIPSSIYKKPKNPPDWYASPEGRRQTQREFERALKNGTLRHSSGTTIPRTSPAVLESLPEQAKANATRPVSIRLSIADIELARNLAARNGRGYQTVLKEAIRYGLRRAG